MSRPSHTAHRWTTMQAAAMHLNVPAVAAVLALPLLCAAWEFHGLVPEEAPVVDVAVWENRAFLAVPRVWHDPRDDVAALPPPPSRRRPGRRRHHSVSAAVDSHPLTSLHHGPTLLEAQWPEPENTSAPEQSGACIGWLTVPVRLRRPPAPRPPRAFPREEAQVPGDGAGLQSAVALEVESFRGAARLWVLDSGEVPSHSLAHLPPKVVVYNLRGNNREVWVRPFDGVDARAMSGLAVDPTASDTRAYVGYPGAPSGSSLLVLSWKNKAFWKVRVLGVAAPSRLPRGHASCWDVAILRSPKRRPRVVISARGAQNMYDLSLEALRGPAPADTLRNDALVSASELGARRLARKPGPSCGLLSDPAGGLLYFLLGSGDGSGAVMHWDPMRGAGSQGHAVVHQDATTLPLASALFLDGQGVAWAACTTFANHHEHETTSKAALVPRRTVHCVKLNWR